ncbi:MAG: Na+/H+ antiporter subunit E [Actinobacteria bacterium]|nr:Na+/H+ antiporter subunit E [Actinomycetota bacterium]
MTVPMNRVTGAVGIVIVWVLLFGELTAANVVGGIVVAVAVTVLFPRRGPTTRHRLSLWGCVVLIGELAVQLVRSSITVARAVIRPTPARLETKVVRVSLSTDSELVGTVVADLITLTPGTLTLDVRHEPERLIVHALGDSSAAEVRASVHALEDQVLRAIEPRRGPGTREGAGS